MLRKESASGETTLALVPPGGRCRLRGVNAGQGLSLRLVAMGLLPGSEVKVLDNLGGPVRLDVDGSRLTLGRGAAEKVLVEVLS